MDKITLKELTDRQKFTDESDIDLIKEWFIANGKEIEGIDLITGLASSKANKLEDTLSYARTWIPTVPTIHEANPGTISEEDGSRLDNIVQFHLLDMPLPPRLLEWAKENIPKMKTPTIIYRPAIEWLKSKYDIEFKDKMI